jgi:GT2 family glycosyltransferase/glycosyltransferase involved in cell wall biosynthesis
MIDWRQVAVAEPVPGAASPQAQAAIRACQEALRAGDLTLAQRLIDRAWRTLPQDADALAGVYALVLACEASQPQAVLRLCARAQQGLAGARFAALAVDSLLSLRRFDEALAQLETALESFCAEPAGELAGAADRILREPALCVPGWVGLTAGMQYLLQLPRGADRRRLRIEASGSEVPLPAGALAPLARGLPNAYRWSVPRELQAESLRFRVGGLTLIAGARGARPEFSLDGRMGGSARSVAGWARLGWRPSQRVRIRIEDQEGRQFEPALRWDERSGDRWRFEAEPRAAALRGDRFWAHARLPDGRWSPLPDTPFLLPAAVRLPDALRFRDPVPRRPARAPSRLPAGPARKGRDAAVDVVVPIHGAAAESLACLRSVLETVDRGARVIAVDDASPDAQLARALREMADQGRIELVRNEANLGFVGSVNRALALRAGRDVVLLNSDAVVFPGWLQRMRRAAYAGAKVATVTPYSNDGTIVDYPGADSVEGPIGVEQAGRLHELMMGVNAGLSAELPVGVGFCLYIRGDCLDEIGTLDEAVFGTGYGEETDFCLKARARGWTHRLCADVFVYHRGGRSFGARRMARLERAQRLIDLRHPAFAPYVAAFLREDPILPLRRRIDEHRLADLKLRLVLVVTLRATGGVDRFVAQRCARLEREQTAALVLRPAADDRPGQVELWTPALALPNLRYEGTRAGLAKLEVFLRSLAIERLEIQHFMGLEQRVIDLALGLGRPYDVYLHDYAWLCPRVTLIGGEGRYCGEPELAACERCVRRNGSNLHEALSVAALRRRSGRWLRGAAHVFAPVEDAAQRYRRHFEGLEVLVQGHEAPPAWQPQAVSPRRARRRGEPARAALIGAIGQHKGYDVLLACARDAARRRLPLEFVVIGFTEDDRRLLRTGRAFVTGRYTDGEVDHLLRRENIDVVLMASVWPETWCYTLDHALRARLPIVALDIGAIGERLRWNANAVLVAPGTGASELNDLLLRQCS